jgi:hypothetical protein
MMEDHDTMKLVISLGLNRTTYVIWEGIIERAMSMSRIEPKALMTIIHKCKESNRL